ncbi:MAG TPA: cysteine synthase family protein, partial [Candidatus Limnocylindrales bacterium]|nr:cysteine synthase family protein [Candidatus Limnocylindrales bacterium]
TGIGLALIGVNKGYRVVVCVPEKFAEEKVKVMRALGAEVIRTPDQEGMQGAIRKAREVAATIPDSFTALQFENPANPDYHQETTAAEIYEQMQGRLDAIVIGVGTGGTYTGVARFMKSKSPQIHCVAVETQGSVLQGGTPGPHRVEGIGSSFVPKTFDRSVCDEIIMVSDKDAFDTVAKLARQEGVLGGSSAGANVFAAIQVARKLGNGKRVVTVIPDSAERYMSKNIFEGGVD